MEANIVRAPLPGEKAVVDGHAFARWSGGALSLLTAVREEPEDLRAILQRISRLPQLEISVSDRPRRLCDGALRKFSDNDWCLLDTMVSVSLPPTEGLAEYARSIGAGNLMVGLPRAALYLADD